MNARRGLPEDGAELKARNSREKGRKPTPEIQLRAF